MKEKPMTRKQIKRFVRKINYGTDIKIKYMTETKRDKKNPNLLCAQAGLFRFIVNKKTGEATANHIKGKTDVMTVAVIEINRKWMKHLWNDEFKAVLLHEVGHFHTGYEIINQKIVEKSQSICEFEAQKWAIHRAKYLKMKMIHRLTICLFHDWAGFKWRSSERIYLKAYKMALKEGILKPVHQCYGLCGGEKRPS